MDIRMPIMDGIAALRMLTADPALNGVRVIMLTTFELDEYVFEALQAGAAGFLIKDSEPADMLRAIRLVAAGESLLSPSVTRRVIESFTSRSPLRKAHPRLEGTDRSGAGGAGADRRRAEQRRDRRAAGGQPGHRPDPREPGDDQARCPGPRPTGGDRVPVRARSADSARADVAGQGSTSGKRRPVLLKASRRPQAAIRPRCSKTNSRSTGSPCPGTSTVVAVISPITPSRVAAQASGHRVVAERRRAGRLDQVAGEDHVRVRHHHHQVAVGVTFAEVGDLDPPVRPDRCAVATASLPVGRDQVGGIDAQPGRLGAASRRASRSRTDSWPMVSRSANAARPNAWS